MMGTTRKTLGALAIALTAAAGTVTSTAVATAAPIVTQVHQAPSAGELNAKMGLILNGSASRSARAAELETGEAGLATFDTAAALISVAPSSWRYQVVNPSVQGDMIYAQLLTATDGYEPWYFDVSWKNIDGTWKLTRESQCTIGNFVGMGC